MQKVWVPKLLYKMWPVLTLIMAWVAVFSVGGWFGFIIGGLLLIYTVRLLVWRRAVAVVSILAIAGFLLGGCSMMDVQEMGTTTTTYYDQTGVKTHDVSEAVMVGDKYTEYTKAAGKIADASERVETARINGILTATAPKKGDSEAVLAWKGAAATLSISQVGGNADAAIRSLYYGKDRYDNADTAIGAGAGVASTGLYTYGATKILDTAFDAVGDSTIIKTEGDGNTTTVEKSEINTENHANTTGDNSPSDVTNDTGQGSSQPASTTRSSTSGTDSDVAEFIAESQESGMTTGETSAALLEAGYDVEPIVEGNIYVDGTMYEGW